MSKLDIQKGKETFGVVLKKTADIGKKVAEGVQKSAKDFSEKKKNYDYLKRMKKYNPIFPDQFNSDSFNLPNMIVIVDDAVRRDIDVCEGAIGWLSDDSGMEVLHLYDEVVNDVGISFIPAPICDTIYYVDRFDRTRFIQTESLFNKAHEEKIAELKSIAYCLGAKRCSIELCESEKETSKSSVEQNVTVGHYKSKQDESFENEIKHNKTTKRKGKDTIEFKKVNKTPVEPELKWFRNDDIIKQLIKMRMENKKSVKSEVLYLEGSSSATMSKNAACAIDSAIKSINIGVETNIENQATKELHSKLMFSIEF